MSATPGRERLDRAIAEIADWFEQDYGAPSGFPWADLDGEHGRPLGERDLSSEIDDYVPLLRRAGRHEYADRQVGRLAELLDARPRALFERPQMRTRAGIRFRLPGLARPRYFDLLDLTEILFGLVESHLAGGRAGELELARRFARLALARFYRRGELRSWYWIGPRWTLPVIEPLAGMIVEGLADLADLTGEASWLVPARRATAAWLADPAARRLGAFRSVRLAGPLDRLAGCCLGAARRFELGKANTSMAWALLALHRTDRGGPWADALDRFVAALDTVFAGDGPLASHLGAVPGRPGPKLILSTNFTLIDLLCDMAAAEERWRPLAGRAAAIADAWLALRLAPTGLLPDERAGSRSYLDANTDLAVGLLRLAELTGEDRYREEAGRTVAAVLEHHRAPRGYYRDVDGRDGRPLGPLVETRFVSLLLKPLLLLRDGAPIYGPGGLAGLMRDR